MTDYRYECMSRKLKVVTENYFEWIKGFTVRKDGINRIHVTLSQ